MSTAKWQNIAGSKNFFNFPPIDLHDEQWWGLVSLENHNFLEVLLHILTPYPTRPGLKKIVFGLTKFQNYYFKVSCLY